MAFEPSPHRSDALQANRMSDDPAVSPESKAVEGAITPDVERGLTGELPMAAAETVVELPQDPSAPEDPLLAELGRAAGGEPLRAVEIAEAQAIVGSLAAHDAEATLQTRGPAADSPLHRLLERDAVVTSGAPPTPDAAEAARGGPAAAPSEARVSLPRFPLDPGKAVSTLNVRPLDPLSLSSEGEGKRVDGGASVPSASANFRPEAPAASPVASSSDPTRTSAFDALPSAAATPEAAIVEPDRATALPPPAAPTPPPAAPAPPPAAPAPPQGSVSTPRVARHEPRRSGRPWGWLVAGGGLGLALGIAWGSCGTDDGGGFAERGRAVGVVEVSGPIADATAWVRDLRRFADGGHVEAIVVRVESPGGSVAPSQETFDAMRAASESVPVVVSIGSTAASGGFWIAMGGDWIVASAGSLTGSIGVISQLPDLRGLADWAGVGLRTYRTGPYKDLGNPLRPVSPGEEAVFMELLSDIYEQFVTVVAERRHLSPDFVRTFADGRVFSGRRAFELGLVDQLGGLELAARRAIQLAEERQAKKADRKPKPIDEQPRLVYPPRAKPSVFDLLAEGAGASLVRGMRGEATRAIEAARTELGGPSVELR
jgi:protease-4